MALELKYNQPTLQKMEALYKTNDYIVRYEKGHFQSGYCVLKDKKVVVVNKFFDIEARVQCLIDILDQVEIDPGRILDEKLKKFYIQLAGKTKSE